MRTLSSAIGASVLAAASFAMPQPARAEGVPDLGPQVTVGHLQGDSGMSIVQRVTGAPVAAIELWYRAPSVGFGPKPVQSLARLAAQTVAASKPLVGQSLGDAVGDVGGKLAITAYGDSIAISALVPSDAAASIVKAMTIAYFSPVISADGLKAAARDVGTDALFATFDPDTIVRDAVFAQLFSDGPQHYPALGPPKGIDGITLDAVRSFAARAFRVQNAVFVVSGAIDSAIGAAASKGRPAGQGQDVAAAAEAPSVSPRASPGAAVTKPYDEPGGGYAWIGPPIGDERAATAMDFIADYLFRPATGVVARDVAVRAPSSSFSGQFITLHDPGVLFVSFSGIAVDDVHAALQRGLGTLKSLDAAQFGRARDAFEYHLLSDLQTPSQLADNFGWYAVEGNLGYAPGAGGGTGAYFHAAGSLTPDFVAHVIAQYVDKQPATVTLVPDTKPAKEAAQ